MSEWKKYLDFHEAQLAQEVEGGEGAGRKREREGQKLETELFEKVRSVRGSGEKGADWRGA